jgi:hypothetical protein
MTFCGYNDTMATGIRTLVEGMIEAMAARHARGLPMQEVVRAELRDLDAMNRALLERARQDTFLPGLCGINLFAQVIFTAAQNESGTLKRFSAACRRHCETFIELVRATEERHQYELAACASEAGTEAIERVAAWLLANEASAAAA